MLVNSEWADLSWAVVPIDRDGSPPSGGLRVGGCRISAPDHDGSPPHLPRSSSHSRGSCNSVACRACLVLRANAKQSQRRAVVPLITVFPAQWPEWFSVPRPIEALGGFAELGTLRPVVFAPWSVPTPFQNPYPPFLKLLPPVALRKVVDCLGL